MSKKQNIFVRFYRFFVPKNFTTELAKGMELGRSVRQGKTQIRFIPTWWLGKGIRRVIDPKHKRFQKKEELKQNG